MDTPKTNQETQSTVSDETKIVAKPAPMQFAELELEKQRFEFDQRQLQVFARSDLVPTLYKNNLANCYIASEMAKRTGMNLLQTMQNLYVIHGVPSWSAQFAISLFNKTKRFSLIEYQFDGDGDNYGCTATATELATGQKLIGPKVSWSTVKKEGWLGKNGSKWQSNPDQMFRYRAATYMIRTLVPEILNGLYVQDEIEDTFGSIKVADAQVVTEKPADKVRAFARKASQPNETAPNSRPADEDEEIATKDEIQAQIAQDRENAKSKARARKAKTLRTISEETEQEEGNADE